MKTFLVIVMMVLGTSLYAQDVKVGVTYVPFRTGAGLSTKVNKMYYNYEFGTYYFGAEKIKLGRLHKASITREFYTGKNDCNNRSIFVGLGYQYFYDKNPLFGSVGNFPLSLEFGVNAKFNKIEGLLSFSFFEGTSNDFSFEGKLGILYRVGRVDKLVSNIKSSYWKVTPY